jgi:DNA-binding MarR family transcriptional regulator
MPKPKTPDHESSEDRLNREAFIGLQLASGRFSAEVEKLCRDEEISVPHYTVLWFLARRKEPDGVPMGAVIDGQLNRASDATRLADRLTALGFIERLASPADRRVVLVRLTDKGREVYLRLTRRIRALHRKQWSVLTKGELEELRRILLKALGEDWSRAKMNTLAAVGE